MNANSRPVEDSLKKTESENVEPPIGSGVSPQAKSEAIASQSQNGTEPPQTVKDGEGRSIRGWVRGFLPAKQHNEDTLRDAIEELIEDDDSAPQSSVAAHERMLISNILELRDLPVVDVMVPRADIVAIQASAPREELYTLLQQKPHSRIPVYKDDLDNIIGVVHMKDLVAAVVQGRELEIRDLMRDVLVVSPAMRVMDMLLQMRQSKVHIAFVVDEFGGIDGLVTINDLISAIVGEIDDEFDVEIAPQLIERPDGSVIVDARMPLTDFETRYGDLFTEDEEHEEADTLGGLVSYIAGRVPARGELIKHDSGLEFEVLDADPRRIMRLRVRNLPQKQPSAE